MKKLKDKIFIIVFLIMCFASVISVIFEKEQEPIQLETNDVEVYFTPSIKCENKIISLIENSQKINIAIFSLTNKNIYNAIIKAKNEGKNISILADRIQAADKYSKVELLYKEGINIKVHTKNKIEHNKFAIFDDNIVSTGSYNWTKAATNSNSENCIFIKNERLAARYQNRFDELWQVNDRIKSELWFRKKLQ